MLVKYFLTDYRCQRIGREKLLVVFQSKEIKCVYAPIGGKHHRNIDLPVAQRLIGQAWIHALDIAATKLKPIGFLQGLEAIRSCRKLRGGGKVELFPIV